MREETELRVDRTVKLRGTVRNEAHRCFFFGDSDGRSEEAEDGRRRMDQNSV